MVPKSCGAHPNQLPARSQFCFPTTSSAAEGAPASKWAGFTHLPMAKGGSLVPTKPRPTNTSAIGACSTRGVFAGFARHWITAVFRPLRGALRSNTPFKVGLRSVRYYGFCHPTAKASRLRVQLHSGKPLDLGLPALAPHAPHEVIPQPSAPLCPKCRQPMQLLLSINLCQRNRGPPRAKRAQLPTSFAA